MTEVLQLQPHINDWQQRGIDVFLVTSARPADMNRFMAKHGLTIGVLLDGQREASRLYGVTGIPATFVIDRDGLLRHHKVGWGTGSLGELT